MTGIKSFNLPAFDAAAAHLREYDHEVISPAELDDPETRAIQMLSATGSSDDLPTGQTWGFFLARDVQLIADDGIEAIVVLPGWDKSRGARLETFVGAALCGLPVLSFPSLLPLTKRRLIAAWAGMDPSEIVFYRSAL
jgi:hypothetical protein